jgi:YgiT-type zinc finger domain-containing protein
LDPCPFCGGDAFAERCVEHLYSRGGAYLLVPNTPATVCRSCGMLHYEAAVLEEIERRSFAIQRHEEQPDHSIELPVKAFA